MPKMPVDDALDRLKRQGSKETLLGMARYGISSARALGVPMRHVQAIAKQLGRDHDLAGELWASGWYEARLLAAYVDDPARVTAIQMDRWCRDFDNWGVCDTLCFALFDRTPHAWAKVEKWAKARDEYVKRAAFALLWGLTVHDKTSTDAPFLHGLALIEQAAEDDRLYVKKAIDMALRAVGKRNAALHTAALETAARLSTSENASARWIGTHAARELTSRLARR